MVIQLVRLSIFLCSIYHIRPECSNLKYCNGHGICNGMSCECFTGYGASTDITLYRAPDCSALTCPSGRAWADVPSSSTSAHALAECSNRGKCDRISGKCLCYSGYTGAACQRMKCPNDCSGHGQCVSMRQMAISDNALPLNINTNYDGYEGSSTWDENMIFGCVCESEWPVGLGYAQRQQAQWFGPDCSLQHCPSGDDPDTLGDETNCYGKRPAGGVNAGRKGNICHIDCANRGVCDYKTGVCACFDGYYGLDCTAKDKQIGKLVQDESTAVTSKIHHTEEIHSISNPSQHKQINNKQVNNNHATPKVANDHQQPSPSKRP
eukprot:gene9196-19063_t